MPAIVLSSTTENITRAAAALRAGDVVAMPTETVYGLAGVAFDEVALAKIFSVKERPTFDPLICHVPAVEHEWLNHLAAQGLLDVAALDQRARDIVERLAIAFWPGPLTLVLPKLASVPDLATSGLPTVGIRSPRHPVAQQLLREVGQPLAAPSANRFGRISPTAAAHVVAELGDRIHYILDGGASEIGVESTVLLVEPDARLVLLRPGAVTLAEIAETARAEVVPHRQHTAHSSPLPSPGLLASHYAPRKPLFLPPYPAHAEETRVGWLMPATLSPSGDVSLAARRLFALLRQLDDDPDIDVIHAQLWPSDEGLGHAINDRLRRAAS